MGGTELVTPKTFSQWTRGFTWMVDVTQDVIGLAPEIGQIASVYDPQDEPFVLRDFARVGRLELVNTRGPHALNKVKMADDAREALESFCNRYGPPLEVDEILTVPLYKSRATAAHFAAGWEVWKALSSGASLAGYELSKRREKFSVFDYDIDRPLDQLPIPASLTGEKRTSALLHYWLQTLIWNMWDLESVTAPSSVAVVSASGFDPAKRYHSLFGFILQAFVTLVVSGAEIRECQHPLCRRDFVQSRSDQGHCNSSCAQAHKQWRLRRRKVQKTTE